MALDELLQLLHISAGLLQRDVREIHRMSWHGDAHVEPAGILGRQWSYLHHLPPGIFGASATALSHIWACALHLLHFLEPFVSVCVYTYSCVCLCIFVCVCALLRIKLRATGVTQPGMFTFHRKQSVPGSHLHPNLLHPTGHRQV